MYKEHFGLYMEPFPLSPSTRFVFYSKAFEETMAHLVYGLEGGEDIVLITGAIGTGKTLALYHLIRHVSDTYRPVLLNVTQLDFLELLKLILADLDRKVPSTADRADLLLALKAELVDLRKQGRRLLLMVDEAQNLSPETLEGLRMLTNLGPVDEQVLQVVLAGQPVLRRTIEKPDLAQLRQRIRIHYHIEPLDANETAAYIDHRCRVAGADRSLFSRDAVQIIHDLSGGIPRLVNVLADKALLAAYVDDADTVRPEHVDDSVNLAKSPREDELVAAQAAVAAECLTPPAAFSSLASSADNGTSGEVIGEGLSPNPDTVEPAASPPGLPPETDPGLAVARNRQRRPRSFVVVLLVLVLVGAGYLWLRPGRETSPETSGSGGGGLAGGAVKERMFANAVTTPAITGEGMATIGAEADSVTVRGPDSTAAVDSGITTANVFSDDLQTNTRGDGGADTTVSVQTPLSPQSDTAGGRLAGSPPQGGVTEREIPVSAPPGLYVHAGSFRDLTRARRFADRLGGLQLPARLVRKELRGVVWYRVLVGPWHDLEAARHAEDIIRDGGIRDEMLLLRIR